jgi:hypothetical protein
MVTVLLPLHLSRLQRMREGAAAGSSTQAVLLLLVDQSRIVWREIFPCVFQAPDDVSIRMIFCLCDVLSKCNRLHWLPADCGMLLGSEGRREVVSSSVLADNNNNNNNDEADACFFLERNLEWQTGWEKPQASTLLIIPPTWAKLEYQWEERLIRLEHDLIRAQSIAGLYSTLGGGYFMTRRLQTATALARQQQRISLLLGDKEMYYKCDINQAYSAIHSGNFGRAKRLIVQVWTALAHETRFHEKEVLQKMCQSAMLFRKRVRQVSREVPPAGSTGPSRVVDDFSRFRVVEDQSSREDLVATAPLERATK